MGAALVRWMMLAAAVTGWSRSQSGIESQGAGPRRGSAPFSMGAKPASRRFAPVGAAQPTRRRRRARCEPRAGHRRPCSDAAAHPQRSRLLSIGARQCGPRRQLLLDAPQRRAAQADRHRLKELLLRQIPLEESSMGGRHHQPHRSRAAASMRPTIAARHYIELGPAQIEAASRKWMRPNDLAQVSAGPPPRQAHAQPSARAPAPADATSPRTCRSGAPAQRSRNAPPPP